jgi:hypothetical protein
MQGFKPFGVQKFSVPPTGTMVGFIGKRDRDSFIFDRSNVQAFVSSPEPDSMVFQSAGDGDGSFVEETPVTKNFSLVDQTGSGVWS